MSDRSIVPKALLLGTSIVVIFKYLNKKETKNFNLTRETENRKDISNPNSKRVAVNAEFFRHLKLILNICIPKLRSKIVFLVVMHSCFLVLRTYLSLVVARIDGRIVKELVAANRSGFIKALGMFFAIAVPATYTNSMIKYCQSKLAISLRTSLTSHLHKLYMGNNNYFKAINLDTRLGNTADQLITTDVKRFCDALASLYSNLGKPVLDIVIFNYQLVRNIGSRGMYGILASYIVTATIMKAITPPFGKLAAEEARLEGNFRIAHSRLITNAEEIAFYNGSEMEKTILDRTYSQLIKHINHIYKIRIAYNMFEDFLIKYSWSAVGLIMASIPVFFPEYAGSAQIEREKILDKNNAGSDILDLKQGSRTQGFITNKRLMVGLADAGGRLMYSYKELSELAGFTFRVYSMIQVLEDINEQKFVQTSGMKPEGEEVFDINKIEGVTEYGHEGLHFKNIPIVTPSGDTVLVKDLNVDINPGDHIMVTGPNGSGKTSILRVISGLWPVFRGVLKRPSIGINEIMYIPQRPYLSIGTLRDQIIYPHNFEDFQKSGRTDKELFSILKTVYLDYIPEREGGMNAVKVWKDVFSGGEKQRIQMARLFYHHPRYVVLDEATSAVSPDVEALMYGSAQDEGITIITISHRPSLFKYHTLLLKVGEGEKGKNWILESISSSNTLIESVDTEIKKIEGHLSDVAELKERLNEINRELKLNVPLVGNDDDDKELKHAKRTLI